MNQAVIGSHSLALTRRRRVGMGEKDCPFSLLLVSQIINNLSFLHLIREAFIKKKDDICHLRGRGGSKIFKMSSFKKLCLKLF